MSDDPLRRPLAIGRLTLERRLIMAPMAGITTPAFRRSVRRWGAELTFTEMISAYGVHYDNRRTLDYLRCDADDHPLGFQLFGADAAVVADAAGRCLEAGADLIDLNMACPVRKVVKTGAGAALLADPERAAAMVAAVVAAAGSVPVTVKLRSGQRQGDGLALALAPRLVEAGAAALCLHPRSAAQLYTGRADHEVTAALAAAVPVPVIASGDVGGRAAAEALLGRGAAAVMLARFAVGRPWLFAEILEGGSPPRAACLDETRRFVAEVLRDDERRGVGYLRQFWQRFRRAGVFDRELAAKLMRAGDAATLVALLDSAG